MVSKLKISRVAPHKFSALLCQASATTAVPLNVYKASIGDFAVRLKCV